MEIENIIRVLKQHQCILCLQLGRDQPYNNQDELKDHLKKSHKEYLKCKRNGCRYNIDEKIRIVICQEVDAGKLPEWGLTRVYFPHMTTRVLRNLQKGRMFNHLSEKAKRLMPASDYYQDTNTNIREDTPDDEEENQFQYFASLRKKSAGVEQLQDETDGEDDISVDSRNGSREDSADSRISTRSVISGRSTPSSRSGFSKEHLMEDAGSNGHSLAPVDLTATEQIEDTDISSNSRSRPLRRSCVLPTNTASSGSIGRPKRRQTDITDASSTASGASYKRVRNTLERAQVNSLPGGREAHTPPRDRDSLVPPPQSQRRSSDGCPSVGQLNKPGSPDVKSLQQEFQHREKRSSMSGTGCEVQLWQAPHSPRMTPTPHSPSPTSPISIPGQKDVDDPIRTIGKPSRMPENLNLPRSDSDSESSRALGEKVSHVANEAYHQQLRRQIKAVVDSCKPPQLYAVARAAGIENVHVPRTMSAEKRTITKTIDDVSVENVGTTMSFQDVVATEGLTKARLLRKKNFYPSLSPAEIAAGDFEDLVRTLFSVATASDIEDHRKVASNWNLQVPDFQVNYTGTPTLAPIWGSGTVTATRVRKEVLIVCRFCFSFYGDYNCIYSHFNKCSLAPGKVERRGELIRLWCNLEHFGVVAEEDLLLLKKMGDKTKMLELLGVACTTKKFSHTKCIKPRSKIFVGGSGGAVTSSSSSPSPSAADPDK